MQRTSLMRERMLRSFSLHWQRSNDVKHWRTYREPLVDVVKLADLEAEVFGVPPGTKHHRGEPIHTEVFLPRLVSGTHAKAHSSKGREHSAGHKAVLILRKRKPQRGLEVRQRLTLACNSRFPFGSWSSGAASCTCTRSVRRGRRAGQDSQGSQGASTCRASLKHYCTVHPLATPGRCPQKAAVPCCHSSL